ncbi:hypothetical protein AX17_004801 [Amanita inopinata Kibby_2008]|nr:hypothetical protein AX17_004801 [Amanita inopinata Kibby_2008]
MLSLLTSNLRLASRVSSALFNGTRPAISSYKQLKFTPSSATRSVLTMARVEDAPMAKEKKKTAKVTKSESETKPKEKKTKKTAKAASPKKTTKAKPKKPAKIVITSDMKPPRPPGGPYVRFCVDFGSKLPKMTSVSEATARAKECSAAWRALSETEKERYRETHRVARQEYLKERQKYFDNVDDKVLKELNRRLLAKGKRRIRKPSREDKAPPTSFFLFAQEFRKTHDLGDLGQIDIARRAGEAWRSLSESDKRPYQQRYEKLYEQWRSRQAEATA